MSEWRENHNGNFVYVDDGVVTTVFQGSDGEWYGIRDGMITDEGFDDPESAMEAIDEEEVEFCEMVSRYRMASSKEGRVLSTMCRWYGYGEAGE